MGRLGVSKQLCGAEPPTRLNHSMRHESGTTSISSNLQPKLLRSEGGR